ncbi:MAG: radical SAM protein, partial [Elusimicrobia bacterium]|nr:radical SAM protein [Elusimicrobiota bacterium]
MQTKSGETVIDKKAERPLVPDEKINLGPAQWPPSVFNVRVQDESGQWIVYNSMTGAIGAIPKDKEEALLPVLDKGWQGNPAGEIKDLAAKGFFVPMGTDERRRAAFLKYKRQASRSLHLIIMPTEECNFRCVYCYESFARGKMLEDVREGIKNLAAKTVPHLQSLSVGWFGGEPTEEMGVIEELSHFMLGICRAHGVHYYSSITTNGFNLTADVVKRLLLCEVRQIQVTLDGLAVQHDGLRVKKGGGPSFETIWANLKEAKKLEGSFKMLILVNFNQKTLDELDGFLSMMKTEFAGDPRFSIFFRPIGCWGGANDGGFEICGDLAGETAVIASARKAVSQGLRAALLHGAIQPHGSVCYAANINSFMIGADGTIYKCTKALSKDINKVGKILPSGEMELDGDKLALWVTADDTHDQA